MEADPLLYPSSNISVGGEVKAASPVAVNPDIPEDANGAVPEHNTISPERLAAMKAYRIQPSTLETISEILDLYNGTKNFWNFTV
jgi:hypothetical protein